MNAPHPLQSELLAPAAAAAPEEEDGLNLVEYWDIILDNRRLIGTLFALAVGLGGTYALLASPVYEANTLVQVEDTDGNVKDLIGQAAGLVDTKTATSAELEILRSRLVIGQAVDSARLYIEARPRYLPVFGAAIARHSEELSSPGFLGLPGYVTGTESITVPSFDVPRAMEGKRFRLTALEGGQYVLQHLDSEQSWRGVVGTPLKANTSDGPLQLLVTDLRAKAGAQFDLVRRSRLSAIEDLQEKLRLAEKGRQSGVIEATLRGADPDQLKLILNEIGRQYVRQNTDRKAAEAGKTLAFLDTQMPQFKRQMNQAEDQYSRYRNQQGTIALDEEAKQVLGQSADLQGKLVEAEQKRRELISRFTPEHPAVQTLDAQIRAWQAEISRLNSHIQQMPTVQQDALRLGRDVKLTTDLYQQLQNSALQLQLVREGKIGNVRVIDEATLPERPVGPNRLGIIGIAGVLGLLGGVMIAVARNAFFRGIRSAQEIEAQTNLNVYSTIPLSNTQQVLAGKVAEKQPGLHLLAATSPDDAAIESLRSLRTALQFAMLDASSNRIIITGATPGVGKSFVSANLAALLASTGKRVLLIDADLRKGHLNQYFGITRAGGLSEMVIGSMTLDEVVRKNLLPNLDLITTGTLPPNPAEIMTSNTLAAALESLSPRYDLVIIDTPPVLVAADTPSIAAHAGTLLLVARAGETQMGELHECSKRLTHAGKGVTGVLLNALDLSRRHYGSYAYKYGGYRYRQYTYTQTR
ncbi:polysaccharide biosynthesis tyrosine autokinase [Ramlibacter sp. G-1-2-2]|uniref:Putative tyrosine-protein kinase EpsB n=1 Tax=Ramlibacter agri TaxID=2728837 RepID=A0A848H7V3_9BURK|nr:polysaccharide biosynthesis tyrosine autokinase [Ramlibacter agri]NML43758.1 polysaccharide biosynthesis tyrosine autokinase [Ramlibacter agri]